MPAYLVSNSNLCRNISSIREGVGRDQQQQRDRQALDRVLLNKQVPEEQMPGHCHCPTILASDHITVSQFLGTTEHEPDEISLKWAFSNPIEILKTKYTLHD